jgi:hypothetical protein
VRVLLSAVDELVAETGKQVSAIAKQKTAVRGDRHGTTHTHRTKRLEVTRAANCIRWGQTNHTTKDEMAKARCRKGPTHISRPRNSLALRFVSVVTLYTAGTFASPNVCCKAETQQHS